eukprot:TRINITY_DN278_c0_g2_i1.p1 TRINITY_DN278_c0_g2~~TRINITY_DN278_c0_g2_i1.p1  ORF type:complete len:205 (+),score=75.23 TRINITY_DN278_c0_g2_i1:98-712(+)
MMSFAKALMILLIVDGVSAAVLAEQGKHHVQLKTKTAKKEQKEPDGLQSEDVYSAPGGKDQGSAASEGSEETEEASEEPAPAPAAAAPVEPAPPPPAAPATFTKIAPFGKEDTAKELQDHASRTQDTLVDAVENAEVAEIKRSVFRALTRLRAASIKEFDTIARLETQAIDGYNDAHHYRSENPLAHLHEEEAPVETDKLKSFH